MGLSIVKPMISPSVKNFETSHLIKGNGLHLYSDLMDRDTWIP